MKYKAIIFDCDGTLVDSMETHFLAWKGALDPHNLDFPKERFYSYGGMPATKIIGILAEEAGINVDAEEIALEKDRLFWEYLKDLKPIEPIIQVAHKNKGVIPLAVATGSRRKTAIRELQIVGILDLFDAIVCAEDVERHKPAPDVYLEAANRLNRNPGDCLAYEDTDIGLQAARDAGMDVIDVRTLLK